MIQIIQFFLRSSPNNGKTKISLLTAAAMIFLGGAANILLLTVVSRLLSGTLAVAWGSITSLILLGVLLGATRGISQYLLAKTTLGTLVIQRLSFCTKITAAPLATLERLGSARLTAAFTESMPSIANALAQLPNVLFCAIVTTGGILYMAWLSWKAVLVLLVSGAAFFFSYRFVNRRAQAEFSNAFVHYRALLKGFRELVDGAKELKLHRKRRAAHLSAAIDAPLRGLAQHRMKSSLFYGVAEAWFTIGTFFTIAIVLAITRNEPKSVGTGFMLSLIYLMPFLQGITAAMPSFSQAASAIKVLNEVAGELSQNSDVSDLEIEMEYAPSWKQLALQGVEYRYGEGDPDSSFRIGPLDLMLHQGETVFVTGGNGSGKTTLMKVLAGLYQPQRGTIEVDGKPVMDSGLDSYRQRFSSVFFDFHLFDQIYGLNDIDAEAKRYLKELRLDHKVTVGEGKFSTIDLSQGQKKRLALLTAYLEDRPIYLFDEWAADQDIEFREFFYQQIIPGLRRRNKTVVVITHDDRYFHLADRLVKMEVGRIADQADTLLADEHLSVGAD